MIKLDINRVHPDTHNPRHVPSDMAALNRLAESMKALGQLQAVVVAPIIEGEHAGDWRIIYGHRRLAAARQLGWSEIGADINDNPTRVLEMQSAENMIREPMHMVDQWRALRRIIFSGTSLTAAAAAVGVEPRKAKLLAKLGGLAEPILDYIATLPAHRTPSPTWFNLVASATESEQLKAWHEAAKANPSMRLDHLYSLLVVTEINRIVAIFDVADYPDIHWDEDLFAPADAEDRFSTRDVKGFLAAQWAALELSAAKEAKRYKVQVTTWDRVSHKEALPEGWYQSYRFNADQGKLSKKDDGMVFTCVAESGTETGEIIRTYATQEKPREHGRLPTPQARPKPPRGAITKAGLNVLAKTQREAIVASLEAITEPQDMLAVLLVAMAGSNVKIEGLPQGVVWRQDGFESNRLTDLVQHVVQEEEPGQFNTDDGWMPRVMQAARRAIERVVIPPAPDLFNSSGEPALWLGALTGAWGHIGRFDTEEFLNEVDGETLRTLCGLAGLKAGKVADMRRELVGKLPDWRPDEARFYLPKSKQPEPVDALPDPDQEEVEDEEQSAAAEE
jgi:ParB family transcriptional regulator, chromosome partitioning protein